MITNKDKKQGFGNQLLIILFTIMYAKIHNLEFYYTPITTLEHIDSKEIAEIEEMLGFKYSYKIISNNNSDIDNLTIMRYINKNILDIDFSEIKLQNESDNKNIALHIRRSNDNDKERSLSSIGVKKYLDNIINTYSDNFYIKLISKLLLKYPNHIIHIYSQDLNLNNYKELLKGKVIFHINTSLVDTFTEMLDSDILVTGASSLSYCAGLLRTKDVIYLPFYYKPLKHWIKYSDI